MSDVLLALSTRSELATQRTLSMLRPQRREPGWVNQMRRGKGRMRTAKRGSTRDRTGTRTWWPGTRRERAPKRKVLIWAAEIRERESASYRVLTMAHRPKRTFRQRRADSSDSDGTEVPSADPGAPGEQAARGPSKEEGSPPGGGYAVAAEPRLRGRGRGRGRVWASSRRAAGAALDADRDSGVPGDAGWRGGRLRKRIERGGGRP